MLCVHTVQCTVYSHSEFRLRMMYSQSRDELDFEASENI